MKIRGIAISKRGLRNLLIVVLLLAPVHLFLESHFRYVFQEAQRVQLTQRLGVFRYRLESVLSNDLALINGLAAFIASNPHYTPEQFDAYAATVLARVPGLINLAAARDLIVVNVYPLAGNEGVLGLDYSTLPLQIDAAQRVLEQGELVIAGPLELVQGGVAFVGRAPVYVNGRSRPWGLVSAPILSDTVFKQAGIDLILPAMRLAMRGRDGLGSTGDVFLGDAALFADPRHITMPVLIGGGEWEIAALPLQDASIQHHSTVLMLRGGTISLGLVILMLMAVVNRQKQIDLAYRSLLVRNQTFMNQVEQVSRVGGWRLSQQGIFTELTGQARELAALPAGRDPVNLQDWCGNFSPTCAAQLKEVFEYALRTRENFDTDIELNRNDGETLWLHIQGEAVAGNGDEVELIGAMQDITEARRTMKLIEFQNHFDPLTKLPNRLLLNDRLQTALNRATRNRNMVAVCVLDLDNFKTINDNLGHAAGDRVLVEMSERIQKRIRASDTLARYSGDEFVVVLSDVGNDKLVVGVVTEFVEEAAKPFRIYNQNVFCSVSIGVALFPDDGLTPDELIIKADQAMHAVKKSGRNAWQYYMNQMQIEAERRHRLYNELVSALQNGELAVHYQPIVDAQTMKVASCEALVRWQNREGQWVAPDLFIAIAEERGLVEKVDYFVMQEACRTLRELNRATGVNVGLSLNVSPRLLLLRDALARQWISGVREFRDLTLSVEITERVLIDNNANVLSLFEELRQLGIGISLDDFGTGYSGLSYFSRFPVTSIKIDRSFVNRMTSSPTQRSLVESMLIMAEKLNVMVIAEGVETEEEARILRELKCNYLQGWYVSRALSAEQFQQFILDHS